MPGAARHQKHPRLRQIGRERVSLDPRGSYPAQIIASQIGKVGWEDSQFEEAERPLVSGLLNLR